MTYRQHRTPQRQYKAVKVKTWSRPISVDRIQELIKKIRAFDLIQHGVIISNEFSDMCYWNAEGKNVTLLTRGELHSEAYKHYNTIEKIEDLVDSEHVKEFNEVFP